MSISLQIRQAAVHVISTLYQQPVLPEQIILNETKPEFEGDYTIVLFGLIKQFRQNPEMLGQAIGTQLVIDFPHLITGFNLVKGFLNLVIAEERWTAQLAEGMPAFPASGRKVMVEYSSPNTNKPLHLGHLRNNFLGVAIANLLSASGNELVKTCVVNDRGIHICKSMLAWQRYFDGATPESAQKKGDHLVGECYVRFEQELKKETEIILQQFEQGQLDSLLNEDREKLNILLIKKQTETHPEKIKELKSAINEMARYATPLMHEVRKMLILWEEGEAEVRQVWAMMNGWVYRGFEETYTAIGTRFDRIYYESNLYLLGKDLVQKGLEQNVFYQESDGSVWIDLSSDGLDKKIVQRRDGTSVYITQDLGLAQLKQQEYHMEQSLYVVGDEQNYHFKVLKLICEKLELPNAKGIEHVSYGMVELPMGRMKSREGTVVDADDLVAEMKSIARQKTLELGKTEGLTESELTQLYETIGLGALKFFLLRVDPKKRIIFNPEESIEFQGFTGPFIQYSYARIQSILRKVAELPPADSRAVSALSSIEKKLILTIEQYADVVIEAANTFDPSRLAHYLFGLAQQFNGFLAAHSVLHAASAPERNQRAAICRQVACRLQAGMGILGISVPARM